MTEDIIKKAYYNPEVGYLSANKLHKKLKQINPKITLQQVQKFIDKQYTNQINKKEKRPKVYSSIVSYGPKNNYQMDIISYDRHSYKNYSYILCVVDVYSRYASARPMTSRELPTIIENIKSIMEEMGWPKNMNCDNEFNRKAVINLMNDHGTKMWFSEPDEINKNAIVERFNRTVGEKIQLWRSATKSNNWPKVLSQLIQNYNNTEHGTTKHTPNEVFNKKEKNEQELVKLNHSIIIGDKVRLKQIKKVFDKNDSIKYSKEVYIVTKIDGNKIYFIDSKDKLYGPVKPYQLKLANEIHYNDDSADSEDEEPEEVQEQIKKEKKLKRSLKKEGLEVIPLTTGRAKKEWKPVNLDYWATR